MTAIDIATGGAGQRARTLSISAAAAAVGIQPWHLRRLEARGVVQKARRTELSRERYYFPEDIEAIRAALSPRAGVNDGL